MRPPLLLIAITIAVAFAKPAGGATSQDRARALYDEAQRMLARHDADGRRVAIDRLEQAVRLAPGAADYWIALGNATLDSDFRTRSRQCFESAERVAPERWEAAYGL